MARLDRGRIEDIGRFRTFSPGMWAWLLHKATGWVLVGYLFAHVAVLSTAIPAAESGAVAAEADLYTHTLQGLEGLLLVRILELGLLTAAVFHMANGIRLLLVDLGYGLDRQVELFYASLVVTAAIVLAGVPVFLPPEVFPW